MARSKAVDVETVEGPATQALATQTQVKQTELAVYEGADATDARGKTNISREDIRLPRLAICQQMSPQRDESKPQFIEGLKEKELFNTLTEQVYGKGPLEFIVLRLDKRANITDKDGNIIERSIPWDDPRNEFTQDPENPGQRIPPEGTRFYDFIIMLVETREIIVLSMKKTQVPVAKSLVTFMSLRPGATWAGKYKVSTVTDSRNNKNFGNYKVLPGGPVDKDLYEYAEKVYDLLAASNISVDDTDTGEQAAERVDDNVPF